MAYTKYSRNAIQPLQCVTYHRQTLTPAPFIGRHYFVLILLLLIFVLIYWLVLLVLLVKQKPDYYYKQHNVFAFDFYCMSFALPCP